MKEIHYTLSRDAYQKMHDAIMHCPSLTYEEKIDLSNKLYEANGGMMGDLIRQMPRLAELTEGVEWRILK